MADTAKARNFAIAKAKQTLPCGVMVARRILVPPVRVRILPGQQKIGISILLISIFITINQVLMLQNRLANPPKLLLNNTFYTAKYIQFFPIFA